MTRLVFDVHQDGAPRRLSVTIRHAVIAGWTGRDPAAISHHIEELAAIGVPPPSTVPLYYRIAASLLTQDDEIEVLGSGSSGEIEPVLFGAEGRLWLTLGSDHTDREAERAGVALSKQLCAKPVARSAWSWEAICSADAASADRLRLESWIGEAGRRVVYQQGTLAQIRPLSALVEGLPASAGFRLGDGVLMFCGTLGAIGGVRPASPFSGSIEDPASGRRIELAYRTSTLPVVA